MNKNSKIVIFGASGLVGSSVVRQLKKENYINVLTPSSKEYNLFNKHNVMDFFEYEKPEYVFLCAAKVGGIIANKTYPVEFFESNISIGMNIIQSAKLFSVKKLINLGSTCIFPKICKQPIKEEYLLSDKLEPSNEAYAIAKIAILKLCEYYKSEYNCNFISAMPTNIFGKNDNYHPENSHVLPAIIRKVVEAKENNNDSITIWGDGTPTREFIYSDDVADALIFLMNNYNGEEGFVNVGTGNGITILEAYKTVMEIIGYKGTLKLDKSKPNGTLLKVSDITKINKLGWKSKISFKEGIIKTYNHLKENNFNWKEK